MSLKTREYTLRTGLEGMYNITASLREAIRQPGVQSGLAVVHCPYTASPAASAQARPCRPGTAALMGVPWVRRGNPAVCGIDARR